MSGQGIKPRDNVPKVNRARLIYLAAREHGVEERDLYFCRECGSGPWHKSWGKPCPNCTGAD